MSTNPTVRPLSRSPTEGAKEESRPLPRRTGRPVYGLGSKWGEGASALVAAHPDAVRPIPYVPPAEEPTRATPRVRLAKSDGKRGKRKGEELTRTVVPDIDNTAEQAMGLWLTQMAHATANCRTSSRRASSAT